MDLTYLWQLVLSLVSGLLIFYVNQSAEKSKESEQRLNHLERSRYTKEETDRQIKLHVDPITQTQTKMWDDIKEIKSWLMSGKH
jgi:hypothetical protein